MPRLIGVLILLVLPLLLMGIWIRPVDQRIVELTNRHAEQQRVQNERLASLQQQWQSERTELYEQRDRLEADRRDLDTLRHREPIVAQSILQVGTLALALLPLAVCALLLWRPAAGDETGAIAETLVDDLLSPHPRLFSNPSSPESAHRLADSNPSPTTDPEFPVP